MTPPAADDGAGPSASHPDGAGSAARDARSAGAERDPAGSESARVDAVGVDPAGYEADGDPVPWRAFLAEAERTLTTAGVDDPAVDARRIVEQASGFEGAELWLGLDEPATRRGVVAFDAMVARRASGEPLQYVLGRWAFRTLDLLVDRRVLIPRPETEQVAQAALDELGRIAAHRRPPDAGDRDGGGAQRRGGAMSVPAGDAPVTMAGLRAGGAPPPLLAVDLGTGSGAIGLSIAVERSDTRVVLTDASPDALGVARANLVGIGRAATRVEIAQGSWFDALAPELVGGIDLIVSNPPYVAPDDDLPAVVRDWEPASALIAADDGTADLAVIVAGALRWLAPGGAVVLEMAPRQTEIVARWAADAGFVDVEVGDDLAARPRWVRARRP